LDADLTADPSRIAASLEQKFSAISQQHPIEGSLLSAGFQRLLEVVRLCDSPSLDVDERNAKVESLVGMSDEVHDERMGKLSKAAALWQAAY